jgi:hypothetical protein
MTSMSTFGPEWSPAAKPSAGHEPVGRDGGSLVPAMEPNLQNRVQARPSFVR